MAETGQLVVAEEEKKAEKDNLDRLLKIFNGGTGVNLGDSIIRMVEAQAVYDSTRETEYERELADIISAAIKGWKVRRRSDMKLLLEEGKHPIRIAQHGREPVKIAQHGRRRVTIEDTRPPQVNSHMTQRVKTFYMDPSDQYTKRDTVIMPNVTTKSARARSMIGGTPINRETAIELRKITVGSTVHSFTREWRKAALVFQDMSSKFPYGFLTARNGSRAFILCFQGYMLKHLIFGKNYQSSISCRNALQPSDFERRKALSSAICEILWQAGNQARCCLCLQQDLQFFDTDYTYRVDGVTEKLNLYEFKKYADLEMFVKRHLSHFEHENSNGCILLLYSVILSRSVSRIYEDLSSDGTEKVKLLTDNEECSPALVNLLLTGRASPFYHNGNIIYDKEGHLLPHPRKGLKERSQIGLLLWDKREDDDERTEIGSMLKTPKNPIWVTLVNGQFGLLFSNNLDLVSDWRVEHRFTLYYYTGLIQNTYAILTVESLRVEKPVTKGDNPEDNWGNTRYTRRFRVKTGIRRRAEEEKIPALEQCILTKWYGANIDWNGTYPFV